MIPAYESYAEALYAAAAALHCTSATASELMVMGELLEQCGSYLSNPMVGTRTKAAVLHELLADEFSPLTLEFITLMATRMHLRHFHKTAELYMRLSGYGKTVVKLRIPFTPEQGMLARLKKRLLEEKLIPSGAEDAEFQVVEDKGLIGGFIASCNGYQIDTSLKTAFMKLLRPERLA
jgi:F0F1-type ATP synthase delta subunit